MVRVWRRLASLSGSSSTEVQVGDVIVRVIVVTSVKKLKHCWATLVKQKLNLVGNPKYLHRKCAEMIAHDEVEARRAKLLRDHGLNRSDSIGH